MAWSNLPVDLLHSISTQLPLVDILHLSMVCTWWNSALANNILLKILCIPSPWLLLPSDAGEASDTLTFRDLTLEKGGDICYRRFSSLGSCIFGRRFIGSKDGWLVTLDKANLQPRLFNPLIKVELSLPSLFTIHKDKWHLIKPEYASDCSITFYSSDDKYPFIGIDAKRFRDVYFHKIVLSSNNPLGTAVVIYGILKLLALAKPGDKSWVLGPPFPLKNTNNLNDFEDVYYHVEDQRFYAITLSLAVMSFDLDGQNVQLICPKRQDPDDISSNCRIYITFLSGSLLRIERSINVVEMIGEYYTRKTTSISIFKFVPAVDLSSCSSSQWISINDLGDYSLFVGCNQTFSLHHTVAPGIRPNCIYFADHMDCMSPKDANRDAGYFDIHNGCFHYFLDSESQPNWPPSIWFTPSLS